MSRVTRPSVPSSTRRPQASTTRPPHRPTIPTSTANRSTTRGTRLSARAGTMHNQLSRQQRSDNDPYHESVGKPQQPERTVHTGGGYQMFTPSAEKREQMRLQAEKEQRQYEAHVERSRMHQIHEVHRLGGDRLSEEEARRRQAEKYRLEKFTRSEKLHEEQSRKKQEEEREIEARKQAARLQAIENEKHARVSQLHSMRSESNQQEHGATGWTDEAREEDRRETMDRFLDRFTQKYDNMTISSHNKSNSNETGEEKLAILRDMLPHIDDQTLEYHLEIYNGNIDAIVAELLN
ncbi:unnamed protein product [Adineta ricciae]|uniref:CUE domain-containing protein n=1 Tax=Adineta ricciae TaxID=249248 RepID=A0A814ZGF8_ADIRI|nr:unnamed protein product [Adineta ricciae]CAF1242872.1 unnamed protein product [Adineta ricciae]